MSFSGEMFFSRPRAVIASRISRDMDWLLGLDEVGTGDVVVRDGDHAGVGGDRHLVVRGSHELAGERPPALVLVAGAHAGAPADEAAEVVGLGERPLDPGRRDREAVVLA